MSLHCLKGNSILSRSLEVMSNQRLHIYILVGIDSKFLILTLNYKFLFDIAAIKSYLLNCNIQHQ